jgi:uncharacterized glyoxalase superfamily protein PhnB
MPPRQNRNDGNTWRFARGGTYSCRIAFKDTSRSDDHGNAVLMGSDAPPQFFSQPQGFSVSISVESTDEAERIFKELADGGTVRMPLQETFWAKRFGMLIDQFGTPWMVNCEQPA